MRPRLVLLLNLYLLGLSVLDRLRLISGSSYPPTVPLEEALTLKVTGLRAWLKVEFPNGTKAQLAVNHFLSGGVSAVAEYSVFQAVDGFDSEVVLLRKKGQSAV